MDIYTLLIENRHFLHNVMHDSFKKYLLKNNIKEASLYYSDREGETYQRTYNIIRDFIDEQFDIYKTKELQIHVKNETRYISNYLKEVYDLRPLPF